MKQMRYLIEAAALIALMTAFRLLPLDAASGLGGWLGRTVGPRLVASRRALGNLESAMPEIPAAERQKIIAAMWDNLGRVMAEYPHLEKIGRERVEI
jgi:KDO2-lipid IV(A) lauroyltransferase